MSPSHDNPHDHGADAWSKNNEVINMSPGELGMWPRLEAPSLLAEDMTISQKLPGIIDARRIGDIKRSKKPSLTTMAMGLREVGFMQIAIRRKATPPKTWSTPVGILHHEQGTTL